MLGLSFHPHQASIASGSVICRRDLKCPETVHLLDSANISRIRMNGKKMPDIGWITHNMGEVVAGATANGDSSHRLIVKASSAMWPRDRDPIYLDSHVLIRTSSREV
jgi:hypothetical protein